MLTRRQFMKRGAAGAGGIMLGNALLQGSALGAAPATAQLPSFTQPLQVPPVAAAGALGTAAYGLGQNKISRVLHPALANFPTRLWSYRGALAADGAAIGNPSGGYASYLGPTIVVNSSTGLQVSYANSLGSTYADDAPWVPVDLDFVPGNRDAILPMTHLHGGFVWGQFDGNPAVDAGYVLGQTQTVWYGNSQRATLLWYHDHGHGTTRLNVFAGLAGAYVIRDQYDTGLADNANGLPVGYGTGPGNYEIPLVIQDRQFVNPANPGGLRGGDWLYPTAAQDPDDAGAYGECGNPPYPYGSNVPGPWIGEYFGNEMLVNGLCTPFLNVEPRVYRFRTLNGCNARFLNLKFTRGGSVVPVPMVQIGSDQGMFAAPVDLSSIVLTPAERADIIVDFSRFKGQTLQLSNAALPRPYSSPAPRLGDVMQFKVGMTISDNTNNQMPPATLQGGQFANLGAPTVGTRMITLEEHNAELPHWYLTLTGTGTGAGGIDVPPTGFSGGNCFDDAISEQPPQGSIQEWDFMNTTGDTHPMHVHLVQFQVVKRWTTGSPVPPDGTGVRPEEKGWKDTVATHPGMTTRIRIKFDLPPAAPINPPSGFTPEGTSPNYQLQPGQAEKTYVYHCHIVEHEDNDMMRPFTVS
jgi:spore coat protein A